MKIKEGFIMRSLCGQNVIQAVGPKNVNFSKLISLNESAAFLFGKVNGAGEFTPEALADLLTGEYEVDYETALRDATTLCSQWEEAGILE